MAWVNIGCMLLFALLFLYYYQKSVRPYAWARILGPGAYKKCTGWRFISMVFMFLTIGNYILYRFFPLPVPLPEKFTWPYWVTLIIAAFIGIPAALLMVIGLRNAGEEALSPDESHEMYGGIYEKIRHPQAYEVVFYFVTALLLNSPFLTILSIIFIPIEIMMIEAEEADLIFRFGDDYIEYIKTTGKFFPKL